MTILWIIFVVSLGTFLFLFFFFAKAAMRRPEEISMKFATVYAGAANHDHQGASPVDVNLTDFAFLDEKGNPVKVEDYNGYVVNGNSMELANIKDGNLLLVRRDEKFTDSTPLPGIFVLRRENIHEGEGQYKLRRIWAVAYLNETDMNVLARGIMNHPEFMQLRKNKELCLDEKQMLEEFTGPKGRLDIYKKEHPHWNKINEEENRIVVSTTLRTEYEGDIHTTKGKHIAFSIHPANLVVGKVAYAYLKKV